MRLKPSWSIGLSLQGMRARYAQGALGLRRRPSGVLPPGQHVGAMKGKGLRGCGLPLDKFGWCVHIFRGPPPPKGGFFIWGPCQTAQKGCPQKKTDLFLSQSRTQSFHISRLIHGIKPFTTNWAAQGLLGRGRRQLPPIVARTLDKNSCAVG